MTGKISDFIVIQIPFYVVLNSLGQTYDNEIKMLLITFFYMCSLQKVLEGRVINLFSINSYLKKAGS